MVTFLSLVRKRVVNSLLDRSVDAAELFHILIQSQIPVLAVLQIEPFERERQQR